MTIKLARTEFILVQGGKLVKYWGLWLTPSSSNTSVLFCSFSSFPSNYLLINYIILFSLIILIWYQFNFLFKPQIFLMIYQFYILDFCHLALGQLQLWICNVCYFWFGMCMGYRSYLIMKISTQYTIIDGMFQLCHITTY